jgi:heat shock protein HtpX
MPASTSSRSRRDRWRNDPNERHRRRIEEQEAAYEAAKVVLERAAARRDAQWREAAEANRRRILIVLALPVLVGVVLVLIGLVFLPLLVAGALLAVGWALIAALTWRRAASDLLGRIGGASLDEAVAAGVLAERDADRLEDLCEGLGVAFGLPEPELRVLPDHVPNALSVGRRRDQAALVVTVGLVELLDRIELEAVIAHELAHVKRLDIASAGVAATTVGRLVAGLGGRDGLAWLEGRDREVCADLAAVTTTRYPPGLADALERMTASGDCRPSSVPAAALELTARTWLVPFGRGVVEGDGQLSTPGRLDVLREL